MSKHDAVYYGINQRTKKHIIIKEGAEGCHELIAKGTDGDYWKIVEADADGWIHWDGEECPVPDEMVCDFRLRSGHVFRASKASDLSWKMAGDGKVSEYRPILDAEPEEPEWKNGLPPVGVECEFKTSHDATWRRGIVVFVRDELHKNRIAVMDDFYNFHWTRNVRPIRTPSQRAEEAMAKVMYECDLAGNISAKEAANALYACIRDGKIPGVTLTEK